MTILAENNEIGESENTISVNNDENDEQTMILDMDELAIQIAPGKDFQPRSILYDNDCEELNFLKIYGGFKFQPTKRITYGARCKSELPRYDLRCAENITKLFYSYKKLVSKKLNSSIEICLKKRREEDQQITPRQALDNNFIKDLVTRNGATIPAEVDWERLIVILVKIKENRDISLDEARNEVSRERKIDLVSKDPITVARYLENLMGELFKYSFRSMSGPFYPHTVVDFFWRVEFQNRGSPHIHMLTWHKDAPKCEKDDVDNNKRCVEFIDKYITVSTPFDNNVREEVSIKNRDHDLKQVNIRYQIHYGFPWPILNETIILEPLEIDKIDENEKMRIKTNYFNIRQHLEEAYQVELYKSSRVETTLDMILSRVGISFDQYIYFLRWSISLAAVFLKRSCKDIMMNPYNKKIFVRHRANMDIQYVIDPYGCAAYISSYMLKSNATISRLLKNDVDELVNDNQSMCFWCSPESPEDEDDIDDDRNDEHYEEETELGDNGSETSSSEVYVDENSDRSQNETNRNYESNYFRVQLMLYLPWRSEEREVEIEDTFEKFNRNQHLIVRNRQMFENVEAENFDRAQEEVECEIQEHYERLIEDEMERIGEANNYLTDRRIMNDTRIPKTDMMNQRENNENMCLNEMYERKFGFHAGLQDELKGLQRQQQEQQNTELGNLCVPNRLNDQEYANVMQSLNNGQQINIANFLRSIRRKKTIFDLIVGGAGVGKRHLIKAIFQTFLREMDKSGDSSNPWKCYALLAAYTGKAAFNIKGSTLHTLFHLPLHAKEVAPMGGEMLNKIKKQFENVRLLIIDEISLVGCNLFRKINDRLIQIKGEKKPFCGISVILVGDFNQLSPVREPWVFENVMRQRNDALFAQALNTLGNKHVYGLSDEQIEMFDNRLVSNINTIPDDAIILCYTNDDGQGKDSNACRSALADLKTKTDLNDTACLPTKILFKLNCKYMITTNMKLNDGLVNGAVGDLKSYIKDDKADRPVLKRVYLDFGDADTCIEWDQQTIKKGTTYKIDRFQFPLTWAEAITIHKSQGQTYQKVAVNLNGVVQRALLFVALNRVTTLDGLYIFNSNPTGHKSIVSDRIRGLTRDKRNENIDEDERCNSTQLIRNMNSSSVTNKSFDIESNHFEKNEIKKLYNSIKNSNKVKINPDQFSEERLTGHGRSKEIAKINAIKRFSFKVINK
ncbi:unnamed protein product [Brachionus calyciflorus]|uniref:ATP-dependent DNA helicase n=1 Tax=Brachionus calyciflorus TaxID=104777 RepID=A0A814LIW1_9BILA|nr:unnamed protein product [Brachionus calyciflorus]